MVERSIKHPLALLVSMLLLGACASKPPAASSPPVEVQERAVIDGKVLPFPNESSIETGTLDGTVRASSAVGSLLVKAVDAKRQQQYSIAGQALERAVRIEPRNPRVWHELADLRWEQARYHQAAQFAQKSNALASKHDDELKRRNWYLLSRAYEALGDTVKADKYRSKLY